MTVALTWVQTAWWATLGAGLSVALVIWALLELLRRSVRDLYRAVAEVLSVGGQLAQNTWTVQLLQTTKARAGELAKELERAHAGGGRQ